jgi:threonine dehydratase
LGDRNFPIIQKHVEKIIRVEEDEIIQAMQLIWERMKIIIEPSCAVPFAAVLKNADEFKTKQVGIILSGGNVDVTKLPFQYFAILNIYQDVIIILLSVRV